MPEIKKVGLQEITEIKTIPLRGGCNTVLETQQIPMGGYSMVQNMRGTHPGFKKRKGQRKQHSEADGTNTAMTLYQFIKTRVPEKHFFGQMSDNDVLKATTAPPGITTGVFGNEVFSGSANSIPASWSNIKDTLIFSNGVDQHQIYHGTLSYIDRIIHYANSVAPSSVPTWGYDYSDEARDGLITTKVILDNMTTYDGTLITNGTFDADIAGWDNESTGAGTFTWVTDHAELDAGVDTAAMGQTITIFTGKIYELTFDIGNLSTSTSVTGGTAAYGGTEHFSETYTTVGSKSITFKSAGASLYLLIKSATDEIVQIDNVVLVTYECLFIKTPVPVASLTFTVSAPNGAASVLSGYYYNGAWTEVSGLSDGTDVTGATMGQTGEITWTLPTDAISNYMYGECGYWMQFRVSAALDAEVEVTKIQFTSAWQSIENVWDGVPVNVIETQFYDASADIYRTYGYASIEIDSATSSDKFYIASFDRIVGIYVDVGKKPNTTASTTVNAVYYWNGNSFVSVGTITDGTNGLSNSGWITFPRQTAHKRQFNENQHYAYWYYFTVDDTLSADVVVSLQTQPYFNIADWGKGYCNIVWKDRVIYGFDKDQYIYATAKNNPQALNGFDYSILECGDGRSNKPVAMAKFYNELMVWQEEKGKEGGCLTLFEGYSPLTFGKLVLSTKIGTLNAKSVVVVDGVYTSTKTDEVVGKIGFMLSHYGIFSTDGRYIARISDDIQNYFDPLQPECIRRGYENQMWLSYDSAYNVIRVGLVSGSSTTCNVFPVYDLADKGWTFDVFEQKPSSMAEVEADSGDIHIIQMVGGSEDGFIYQSNYGDDDVSTAIDAYIDTELNAKGYEMELDDAVLTMKTGVDIVITPYVNDVAQTAITETAVSKTRTKYGLSFKGADMRIRIQNNTASEALQLFEFGMKVYINEDR